ncbi:hypothetical protein BC351_00630 [Paenibacillus ferrarius]|uniref:Uncharacterized protein n=1 Tax=Paenibacillus ferrarius TaxID=1469647 RepID=A0A1V4HS53_9BACL|nr:hypothetical protein [Paenibacillus ferrarius]OPH61779.1 hypothetical protein BC351_00630 [Paenibacillus ferrarius]
MKEQVNFTKIYILIGRILLAIFIGKLAAYVFIGNWDSVIKASIGLLIFTTVYVLCRWNLTGKARL